MTFVGRRKLLSLLHEELRRALGGTPRLVLVEGSAGIGKTALLKEFLERSDTSVELAIAMGGIDERQVAYGYVEQMLGAGALPADGEQSTGMVGVGRRLLSLFDELQAKDVGVVVLEDVQWADLSSLRALAFALRRLHADRIMAVLTARSDELSWIPEGLLRIVHDSGTRIEVPPLSVDEAAAFAVQAGVDDLARSRVIQLVDHTGGNPLHLELLLDQLPEEVLRCRSEEPLPAPREFAALVAGRIAHCSRETERLVAAGAVLGQRWSLATACRVGAIEDVARALEQGIAAGLIHREADDTVS